MFKSREFKMSGILSLNHFASHFKAVNVERPRVEELDFRRLSMEDSSNVTGPFTLDEVKQA